ncbi:SAM-dependent methyltransferase [Nonomuraea sp. SBT364]|uniref:SAM-dependent methyltransferase n=1 Tax=Nonomuraea sp. SBT364 TaxID=1580530 RepID=UPI00066B2D74|nr:SAM-dependent methyltransferase [Nonomuraea sp. SBT364]
MSDEPRRPGVSAGTPSVARMNDFFLGGKDNFAADREAVARVLALAPEAKAMGEHVQVFREKVVRHLAQEGVTQFVHLGSWLPTQRNVHEMAQEIAPESRVVYAADDPVALNHARAILARDERVGAVEGSILRPDELVADPATRRLIDFDRPVAVLIFGSLQYIPDGDGPFESVARLCALLPAGSYLGITHAVFDSRPDIAERIADIYRQALQRPSGGPRTRDQVARFFDGLELVEPGFVYVRRWRPESPVSEAEAAASWVVGGLARKPA